MHWSSDSMQVVFQKIFQTKFDRDLDLTTPVACCRDRKWQTSAAAFAVWARDSFYCREITLFFPRLAHMLPSSILLSPFLSALPASSSSSPLELLISSSRPEPQTDGTGHRNGNAALVLIPLFPLFPLLEWLWVIIPLLSSNRIIKK